MSDEIFNGQEDPLGLLPSSEFPIENLDEPYPKPSWPRNGIVHDSDIRSRLDTLDPESRSIRNDSGASSGPLDSFSESNSLQPLGRSDLHFGLRSTLGGMNDSIREWVPLITAITATIVALKELVPAIIDLIKLLSTL